MSIPPSREWSVEGVLQRLRNSVPGQKASIQVFLRDGVEASEVQKKSRDIVDSADPIHSAKMGRVRSFSKSFSIEGEVEILERIAHHPDVKSILPSEAEDIFPKPVNKGKSAEG